MTKKTKYTYADTEEEVDLDSLGEEIDAMLESSGRMFVAGSDGHRYIVSVSVELTQSD